MDRREFLRAAGLGGVGLWTAVSGMAAPGLRPGSPNVVIILADDLGYGDLGCYGNTAISTPNIDALAAAGLRFTDFHSNGAVCSPTRASLLTGYYPQRWGIENVLTPGAHRDKPGLPTKAVTFAEMLQETGYKSAMTGKWHLGYPEPFRPTKQGFAEFKGYLSGNIDYHSHIDNSGTHDWWANDEPLRTEGYTTDLITQSAVGFIESQDGGGPFCLYVAHEAPHAPFQGRTDLAERVEGTPDRGRPVRTDAARPYREMVEALDESVGKIMDALQRSGNLENTFVFFCSDNGATAPGSNAPFTGTKGTLREGGHRVPAIAWWPEKIAPGVTDQTAMTMDIFPTLAELGGRKAWSRIAMDGVSLAPLLTAGTPLPERTLFWRTGGEHAEKAVRQGTWKLHITPDSTSLYNLEEDPAEQANRMLELPSQANSLAMALSHWEDSLAGIPPIS